MREAIVCPHCGKTVPPNVPEGLCPACLKRVEPVNDGAEKRTLSLASARPGVETVSAPDG